MLVLVCWIICAKIEPAVRSVLMQALSYLGKPPQRRPASRRPALARGLRLRPARSLSYPDALQRETLLRRAGTQTATRHDARSGGCNCNRFFDDLQLPIFAGEYG
jgi:hypothetical protein